MSKVPSPPRLPAAKSLSKRATASQEHDRLLRLVWDKVDLLASVFYATNGERLAARERDAADAEHRRDVASALEQARSWVKLCGSGEMGEALASLVEQLKFAKKRGVPKLKPELWWPRVESKRLAAPICSDLVTGSGRTVGYIDVEVRMQVTRSIRFHSGVPHWLTRGDDAEREARAKRAPAADAATIRADGPKAASWSAFRHERRLWIDVRPSLAPIGQLLRELKVLRQYAPVESDIVVVYTEDDAQGVDMLEHEGFVTLSESEINEW